MGMALSAYRECTVIVKFEQHRVIADLVGLNKIRFAGSAGKGDRSDRAAAENAGCAVDEEGTGAGGFGSQGSACTGESR
ncbi:hypothetical protein [Streptomyces lunaelactis]|nr:hypothetical protein [Streptomyces lunaelactis]NUK22664.1 hypothetical protein [Streptomyces lunaelactis]